MDDDALWVENKQPVQLAPRGFSCYSESASGRRLVITDTHRIGVINNNKDNPRNRGAFHPPFGARAEIQIARHVQIISNLFPIRISPK